MLINYNVVLNKIDELKKIKSNIQKAFQAISSNVTDPKEKKKKAIFEYIYYKIAYVLTHPNDIAS
jgi:hypothetical protein